MDHFFTWATLATFSGASAATAIITQFIKGGLSRIPTQLVSYVVALVILLLATAAIGGVSDWTEWAILPFNAILVSVSANGAFSVIERVRHKK